MDIEAMEFYDLHQMLKTLDKPYLNCFRLDEKRAIYYEVFGGSPGLFAFCTDNYIPFEYIKEVDNKIIGSNDNDSAKCIALAHIKSDSLLLQVLCAMREQRLKESKALLKKTKSKKPKQKKATKKKAKA